MLERTKVCSIILAAGSGKRFGTKKQFLKLAGKHLLLWSVERFLPFSDKLLVVLPPGETTRLKDIIKKYPRTGLVEGGAERYDSVRNALRHIPTASDIICVHDGVRPFVSGDDIRRCISAAARYGAAICACSSTDTVKTGYTDTKRHSRDVKLVSPHVFFVRETLNRNNVFLVQTPQAFRRTLLLAAYTREIPAGTTDDAQLVELMGHRVAIVPCSPSNIKITTKTDFAIARVLAKEILKT